MKTTISILFSLLFSLCYLFVQRSYSQLPAFYCTRLTTADGLSDNMVFCALQDKQGFMWFGTRDGLNRYDGYKFTVYKHNPQDSTSLASNSVSRLFEDRKGNLWVGSNNGIQRFDSKRERFINYYVAPSHHVTSICDDKKGNIWFITVSSSSIGLDGANLIKLQPNTNTFVSYQHEASNPFSVNSNAFRYLCCDSNGTVWVTTWTGINRYDERTDRFLHSGNTRGLHIPVAPAT